MTSIRGKDYLLYARGSVDDDLFRKECREERKSKFLSLLFRRPQFSAKVDFLRQCAQMRMVTQKFHTFGRLWELLNPTNTIPTFEEEFRDGGLRKGKIPSVEARLWQSEDGHLAVFIANYADKEIPFTYSINPAKYALTADKYEMTEITPEKTSSLSKTGKQITRTEIMKPNKVRVK